MIRIVPLLLVALVLSAAELSPGSHTRRPCDGAAHLTWDVYVPKAYAAEPERAFPVLFISSPGGNPGYWGFEPWAERQGVLLVGINDSKNGDWAPIHEAQTAVLRTVKAQLRVHRLLRFATGSSGGAWASAELAKKCGDEFGGVLFQINSQRGTPVLKHICCAYLAGVQDTTYGIDLVRGDCEAARQAGNPVRSKEYPDKGHEGMPLEDQVAMLDWMLEYQRYGHPMMNRAEAEEAQARLVRRVAEIAALSAPAERAAQSDGLLQSPVVAKGKQGVELSRLWSQARLAMAEAETDPVRRYRILEEVSTSARSAALPAAERKPIATTLAELRKDKAVKSDIDSRAALAAAQAAETKAGRTKGKLKEVLGTYQSIRTRWPGTPVASEAEAGIKRVQALLQ